MYCMLLDFTMFIKVYGKLIGKKSPCITESVNSSDGLVNTVTNINKITIYEIISIHLLTFGLLSINLIHLMFKFKL